MKRLLVEIVTIGNRLAMVPADQMAEEDMAALDRNKLHMVSVTTSRRPGPLRKYWGAMTILHNNLPDDWQRMFPTKEKLSKALLRELGYTERQYRLDGSWTEEVDSIALSGDMDDAAFADLMTKVDDLATKVFGWAPIETWETEQEAAKANRQRRRA